MNEEKSVEVIQADRDAAADLHEVWTGYGATGRTKAMRAGNIDKHDFVQAFARHRLRSTPPAADAVEAVARAIIKARHPDRDFKFNPIYDEVLAPARRDARAAISAYERRGVDSGFTADRVERAEWLWANLPTGKSWTSLATHEKALVIHTIERALPQPSGIERLVEAAKDALPIMEKARDDARAVAQMRRKVGAIATACQQSGHALSRTIESLASALSSLKESGR